MTEESQSELQTAPRFQFVRELGRGVLGEVHEVIDEVRGEPVVLKVFLRCRPRNPDRFQLEFESLARLEHPSLVKFHHLVDPRSDTNLAIESRLGDRGLAFTQEYVDGVDLLSWLRRMPSEDDMATMEMRRTPTTGDIPLPEDGELETGEALAHDSEAEHLDTGAVGVSTDELGRGLESASSIVEELAATSEVLREVPLDLVLLRLEHVMPQVVSALQYLHRFHKVHGFLRPSNILVTNAGDCKLTDFGIVPGLMYRPPDDGATEAVSLLEAPEQLPYVAPEVTSEATVPGDLYALGCVLFEAIAGYPPADALEFVAGRTRRLELPPLAELVPECPAAWAERIDALLKRDPEDRPSLGMLAETMRGAEARAVQLPPTIVPEPEHFVGQTSVLTELRQEARAVSDERRMRLILLQGEGGSGKSMISEEIAHWLSRRGWLVITGQCFHRESVPYQGWHQIARRIAQVCDALPPSLQEQIEADRRVAGVLFRDLFPAGAPMPEGDARAIGRLAAIRAMRRLLGFLAEQRPILLAIEDLHWASWDSASLLMDLFSETAEISCLVLGTWRDDTRRSEEHFLLRDLELSLIDVRRLPVIGFTTDEAREFLVTRAPNADVDQLRTIIRAGRANPRILQELLWELERGDLEQVHMVEAQGTELLPLLYRSRMEELDKRHDAILNLLSVASGPLEQDWLYRAVEAELSGSVLPSEQTTGAISGALKELVGRRLVRKRSDSGGGDEWLIAHDLCREVVLDRLSDRDRARLSGRIADSVGEHRQDRHDLRFEYELRAQRVAKAIKSAVRAARVAEARFAYHRAAKLWRWLLENREKVDDPTVDPGAELARIEHLAGQHAEAAELYHSWADKTSDPLRRAQIHGDEAAAWLQAGDRDASIEALEAALGVFGQSYTAPWHASISEAPRRWVATLIRWNQKLAETCEPDAAERAEQVLGNLYDFALEYNDWLDSDRGPEIEARLARLADGAGDARLLGLHRLRLAVIHAGHGASGRRDRAFQWLDEAERMFEKLDDRNCTADVHLQRSVLHIHYAEYSDALACLDEVAAIHRAAEDAQNSDRRFSLYWRAMCDLRVGELDQAERLARQLLHTYRGDRVVATNAYQILAELSLVRGEAELAAAFVDAGKSSMTGAIAAQAKMRWVTLEAQLHVLMGRPEVAVGQLDVLSEKLDEADLLGELEFAVPLRLAMGQAASALAERQRVLSEPRRDVTMARLREVQKRLDRFFGELDPIRLAESNRLFALIALATGKPRKALRHADAAIEALGATTALVEVARCTEARGLVLARMERPDARGIIEQAWELYRHCGVVFPLVLEGWPVPREASMLKED